MYKKGLILVLITSIISGISIFINKFGVDFSNPYIFAFLKNTAVALIFTGLIVFFKYFKTLRQLKPKQWLILLSIGLIGGSIPFLLFFKGLSMTSAAQGSFLQKTMFIYVVAMAVIFLKEKVSKNFLIGALLLLLGNLLALKTLKLSFGYGDLLIFIATLFWALENIISKYALRDLPPKIVAWGRMFFGSIFISCFLALTGQTSLIFSINPSQITWILITSALLFGYIITWYSGLKNIPVSLATTILLLGSPITTLLSLISAGKIHLNEAASGIIILCGLIVTIFAYKNFYKKPLLLVSNH